MPLLLIRSDSFSRSFSNFEIESVDWPVILLGCLKWLLNMSLISTIKAFAVS